MAERIAPEELQERVRDLAGLLGMMKHFDGREHLRTVTRELAEAELDLGPSGSPLGLIKQYFERGGTKAALTGAIQSDEFLTLQAQHDKGQGQ